MRRLIGCLALALVASLMFGLSAASAAPRCQASDLSMDIATPTVGAVNPFEFTSLGSQSIINFGPLPDSVAPNDSGNRMVVVQFRNVSSGACSLNGWPRLALLNGPNSLPIHVRRARLANFDPEERITIRPGQSAAILFAYPTRYLPAHTRCRTSTTLQVALPGIGHLSVPAKIRACNGGSLTSSSGSNIFIPWIVSPILPPATL